MASSMIGGAAAAGGVVSQPANILPAMTFTIAQPLEVRQQNQTM